MVAVFVVKGGAFLIDACVCSRDSSPLLPSHGEVLDVKQPSCFGREASGVVLPENRRDWNSSCHISLVGLYAFLKD